MKNVNAELISVAQGLAFVEVAFGAPFEEIVVVEEETPTNATQTNGLVLGANYIA
jgi:hypothetical protein